jgi:pimeloyl-ACP methyl ester carboxylesterase
MNWLLELGDTVLTVLWFLASRWVLLLLVPLLLGTLVHMARRSMRPADAAAATSAVGLVGCLMVLCPGWAVYTTLRHTSKLVSQQATTHAGLFATLTHGWHRTGWWQLYLLVEAAFLLLFLVRCRQLQAAGALSELNREQRQLALDRALATTSDRRALLSGWFQGAEFRTIHRGNAEEWGAWALWGQEHSELSQVDCAELSALIDRAEQHWKLGALPPGYNEELRGRCMRLSLDRIAPKPRPLIIYALVMLAQTGVGLHIRCRHHYELRTVSIAGSPPLRYWYRPAADNAPPSPPVVLLHGVGAGGAIAANIFHDFLRPLQLGDSAVIAPELPSISYCPYLWQPPLSGKQMASCIASIVRSVHREHGRADSSGAGGAVCIGHSFGTVVLAWLLKHEPDTVASALFIDPVVFMLHEAALCCRFLYKPCRSAQDHLLRYFGAEELHIQHYLRRHFIWHENIVWLEELPERLLDAGRVVVVLGSGDSIIDAPSVCAYLRGKFGSMSIADRVRLIVAEGAEHGDWGQDQQVMREMVMAVRASSIELRRELQRPAAAGASVLGV